MGDQEGCYLFSFLLIQLWKRNFFLLVMEDGKSKISTWVDMA